MRKIKIFILSMLSLIVWADGISGYSEEELISMIESDDVSAVNEGLKYIAKNDVDSIPVRKALVKLLDDPRPGRRVSRDVIELPPRIFALKVLSDLVGFKPSQPSLRREDLVREFRTYLNENPALFEEGAAKKGSLSSDGIGTPYRNEENESDKHNQVFPESINLPATVGSSKDLETSQAINNRMSDVDENVDGLKNLGRYWGLLLLFMTVLLFFLRRIQKDISKKK